MKKIFALTVLLASTSVQAVPVTWTFNDVLFDDGTYMTGSFVYDASIADRFSAVLSADIYTQGNPAAGVPLDIAGPINYTSAIAEPSGDYFAFATSGLCNASSPFNVINCGYDISDFITDVALTDLGGVVGVSGTELAYTNKPYDFDIGFVQLQRRIVSGTISAVPVPAAVWLFGSALIGLGWVRRR